MTHRKRVGFVLTYLIFGTIMCVLCQEEIHATHHNSLFCNVPPDPSIRTIEQPDGSSLQFYIVGGQAVSYLETLDGFTIQKDPSDGYFKYVIAGRDGDLYLTDIRAADEDQRSAQEWAVLRSISKHARYTGNPLSQRLTSYSNVRNGAGAAPAPNGVFPSIGTRKALLLLIDFPDESNTFSKSAVDDMVNKPGYNVNGQSGSFRDYYLDISYGALTINTDTYGWYTSSQNKSWYGYGNGYQVATDLVREAVDAAENAGVNFAHYDGDGDNKVDVVMVIHAGRGREESGDDDDIWSHRWVLSGNGNAVTYDGKYINDYIIQPEKYGSTNISNIGVFCHEFGHALGLPDLYDTDYSSNGLGKWCLMAGGTWNNSGRTPAQMSAWCKSELGWMTPQVLTGNGTISNMNYSDVDNESYRFNTGSANEYFLLENRQKEGWDAYIPGEGLAIYHIDESRSGNTEDNHYLVHLEQADGDLDLNSDINSGDNGDLFPGASSNHSFTCYTDPKSDLYNGDPSNVSLYNISENGTHITFSYGACVNCNGTPQPGNTLASDENPCGGMPFTLTLSGDLSAAGYTYQWQESENGSSFTNIAGATSDTYMADFQGHTFYRCKVTCSNSGKSGYSSTQEIGGGSICYCDAGANSSQYEKISNIQFHTIDHSSQSTAGYEDFTNVSASVEVGNTYDFTAIISNAYNSDQIIVWIDFNQNGQFNDPGEEVYRSGIGTGPHQSNIQIAGSAKPGNTTMRVRLHDTQNGGQSEPCGNSQYGQVEDYQLIIDAGDCINSMALISPDHDITSGAHKMEAGFELEASNRLMGGSTIYDAGDHVLLQPGFEVSLQATFEIVIDGCGGQ